MVECMFSGETADTEEHVIPKWLQRRFNLWNQSLTIPNGTRLKYRYLKVPVTSTDNEKFGQIEDRIRNGVYILQEVYLWALKIHVGLLFRDASLRVRRDQPSSGYILDLTEFYDEIVLFRMLYTVWKNKGSVEPNPFGTVLCLRALRSPTFDFMHCFLSGTVALQIGEDFIYVSLWDQADGMDADLQEVFENQYRLMCEAAPAEKRDSLARIAQQAWACETTYWLMRQRRNLNIVSTDASVFALPPLGYLSVRAPEEYELALISRNFGLQLQYFSGEFGNRFGPLPGI